MENKFDDVLSILKEEAKLNIDKIEDAHDCEKCHGKIIAIEIDMFGNTHCGYCHQQVQYPKPSIRLIEHIRRYLEDEKYKPKTKKKNRRRMDKK